MQTIYSLDQAKVVAFLQSRHRALTKHMAEKHALENSSVQKTNAVLKVETKHEIKDEPISESLFSNDAFELLCDEIP